MRLSKKDILKYESKVFRYGEKPFDTSAMKAMLAILKSKRRTPTNAATVAKAIVGDQIREDNNHHQKSSKMKEDLEKLKSKKAKVEENTQGGEGERGPAAPESQSKDRRSFREPQGRSETNK